jgi:hypothetical protein
MTIMEEIDALRGEINRLLDLKRGAGALSNVGFVDVKEVIDGYRKKVESLLQQWWAQDCKEDGKQKSNPLFCECNPARPHPRGNGECFYTGDVIGDLDRIIARASGPQTLPEAFCTMNIYMRWKQNYGRWFPSSVVRDWKMG